MALNIEKRTRALVTDNWGDWITTTDAPPYTDTTLVEYRSVTSADVLLSDLTSGNIITNADNQYVWSGSGVFDKLVAAVNSNVKAEYDNGRITGTEYATVYLGALQSVIAQSVQFLVQDKMQEDKVATSAVQRDVLEAQRKLYDRQREAFDDNKYQKVLEAQLNYNGMVFQDASAPSVLGIALETEVNDIFNKLTGNDPTTKLMPET